MTEVELPPESPGSKPQANPAQNLPRIRVMIATPAYGGMVTTAFMDSMIDLFRVAPSFPDISITFNRRDGDSLITRARNQLVGDFLASNCTHLLFIDSDIGFHPSSVYRLLQSGHDVVGGVYPLKATSLPETLEAGSRDDQILKHQGYPFNPIPGQPIQMVNGFIEVLDLPTGQLVIRRNVFERMMEAYPELQYRPDRMLGLTPAQQRQTEWAFFDCMIDETGRYLSEDYSMMRRWQRIGGKVYADGLSKLIHVGRHSYRGDFMRSLELRYGRSDAPDDQPPV